MNRDKSTPGKPKILIVTTVPDTLELILTGQPRQLSETFDIHLVTSNVKACEALQQKESVPAHHVEMARRISPLRDLLSVIHMCRLLRRLRPDAVHSYTPKAGLVAMLAGAVCRIPVRIHTFTGLIFPTAKGIMKPILVNSDRFVCFLSTRVVPESIGVKNALLAGRITRKPLKLIGSGNIAGIDVEHYSRNAPGVAEQSQCLAKELGVADDTFVFLFIGRLNLDKGVQELVAAFISLVDSRPNVDLRLLVVGPLDETAPIGHSTQRVMKEHPGIHCVGFQSDVRPFLFLANVLCLPSYREGFPNVLLQANAMSVPAITTNISGCNEIITPDLNGWIVHPRDEVHLAEAMAAAFDNRGKLPEMGSSGRKRVERDFERSAYIAKLVAFYQYELANAKKTIQSI